MLQVAFAQPGARTGKRILVFGPYRPKSKDWKMGNINIEETKQVTFLGRKIATNKIQGTRTQLREVALRAGRAAVMLKWAGCFEENQSLSLLGLLFESLVESVVIAGATTIQLAEEGRMGTCTTKYDIPATSAGKGPEAMVWGRAKRPDKGLAGRSRMDQHGMEAKGG